MFMCSMFGLFSCGVVSHLVVLHWMLVLCCITCFRIFVLFLVAGKTHAHVYRIASYFCDYDISENFK